MQYYPQHFFGFALNENVAEKLDLTEAFDSYEMSYEEDLFFEGFDTKFGIEPYKFADTTYERGGYVQGLQGFDWDTTYVCFHPATSGDDRWRTMVSRLSELGIEMEEGHWSQLG
jgi:hypothetical protein